MKAFLFVLVGVIILGGCHGRRAAETAASYDSAAACKALPAGKEREGCLEERLAKADKAIEELLGDGKPTLMPITDQRPLLSATVTLPAASTAPSVTPPPPTATPAILPQPAAPPPPSVVTGIRAWPPFGNARNGCMTGFGQVVVNHTSTVYIEPTAKTLRVCGDGGSVVTITVTTANGGTRPAVVVPPGGKGVFYHDVALGAVGEVELTISEYAAAPPLGVSVPAPQVRRFVRYDDFPELTVGSRRLDLWP